MTNSYQKLNTGARLDNFETPKAFIPMVAKAIEGRYGDPDACLRTVLQYWKNTTAGLDREGEAVDPKIMESATNVSSRVILSSPTGNLAIFSS